MLDGLRAHTIKLKENNLHEESLQMMRMQRSSIIMFKIVARAKYLDEVINIPH